MRRLGRFLQLTASEQLLLLEAAAWMTAARLAILTLPVARLSAVVPASHRVGLDGGGIPMCPTGRGSYNVCLPNLSLTALGRGT